MKQVGFERDELIRIVLALLEKEGDSPLARKIAGIEFELGFAPALVSYEPARTD